MANLAPFLPLAIALAAFLFSTRQMGGMWRSAVWIAGVALLVAAAIMALSGPLTPGVLQAIVDQVFGQLGGEVLATAVDGNFPTVGAAIAPMFGVFFVLTIVVAIVSLIAFTPGQGVERFIRPVNIAIFGAVAGAIAALVVAGVGFGGLEKRRVYHSVLTEDDVVDGDTIRMGDMALRLWGIDAPEYRAPDSAANQRCRRKDATPYDCGAEAKLALEELVDGKLVICEAPTRTGAEDNDKPPYESFGRPVMSCWAAGGGGRLYLSAEMARQGWADEHFDNRFHDARDQIMLALTEAKAGRIGMWSGWTLSAENWREGQPCREWFQQPDWRPPSDSAALVECPSQAVPVPANDNSPTAANDAI
jgi:endonuclease YncB( thermonuclease family)